MSTKKISVNPELFRVTSSRTRRPRRGAKEREDEERSAPTISLSSAYRDIATSARLKKKLQNRLNKNIASLSGSYSRAQGGVNGVGNGMRGDGDDDDEEATIYQPMSYGRGANANSAIANSLLSQSLRRGNSASSSTVPEEDDEFSHSVRYLQQLKQQLHHQQQTRQQMEMGGMGNGMGGGMGSGGTGAAASYPNTTVYSHPTASATASMTSVPSPYQYVSLEVPSELKAPAAAITSASVAPLTVLENREDVPFGCLKGGRKKTFREWKEDLMEQEQMTSLPSAAFFTPRPPTPPKTLGTDAYKLSGVNAASNALAAISVAQENMMRNRSGGSNGWSNVEGEREGEGTVEASALSPFSVTKRNRPATLSQQQLHNKWLHSTFKHNGNNVQRKNVQTFRRKYTVGKFDKLNKVSILIKDKETQKNILQMHRTLKKTPIADMRKYLRQRGLIKIGSVCPPDLLRKMFESAVLAGEITNMNKNTLLHNLMHLDKEREK